MADQTTTLRRCIGSTRFGIEPHEAPVEDFPTQPSQNDGLGRMCRLHWNRYTTGLAHDARVRKEQAGTSKAGAAPGTVPALGAAAASEPGPRRTRRARVATPKDDAPADAA